MSDTELKLNDILAIDRTRMAAERTLMAWVRTALSMITFGFSIYKVLQALQQQSTAHVLRPQAPRNTGLTLIGIGIFVLIVAGAQHVKYIKKLGSAPGDKQWDLSLIVACLIAFLGILLFGSIILNAGPFG
jgi:putative membrane protein